MEVNSENPEKTSRSAVSDLGLPYLPMPMANKKDTRLIYIYIYRLSKVRLSHSFLFRSIIYLANVIQNLLA